MRDENGREVLPGEGIAIDAGCICTVRDGEPVDNDRWPEWLTAGCPVHGDKLAPVADGAPQQ